MALVIDDRVRETTTVTGTNDAILLGAVVGFQSFSVIGNTNTTYYTIADQAGSAWEVGIGTYSTSGPTLQRTTVLASSNGGAKVVFSSGTKDVFVTYPSDKAVYLDASGDVQPALGTVNATTVDTTNIEVTNLKAKDGTSAGSIANSTGVVTLASSVLTTTDINGGTIDNTAIGGSTAAAGAFTTLSASGVATFSAGTVSLPAITTTGDTNTGIFFPAADNIAFTEGGVESMRIDASGNVGIGTASPDIFAQSIPRCFAVSTTSASATININAAAGARLQLGVGGTRTGMLYSDSTNYTALSTETALPLVFLTNQTERMRITSGGDVGIGTSSPGTKLNVVGGNVWSSNFYEVGRFVDSTAKGVSLGYDNTSYTAAIGAYTGGTASNLSFWTYPGSGLLTERMRITSDGRVGIGVTTPSFLTEIVGGTDTVETTLFQVRSNAGGINTGTTIALGNSTNPTAGSGRVELAAIRDTASGSSFVIRTADSVGTITERMRIDSSGNVGIGTASPSFPLDISAASGTIARIKSTGDYSYLRLDNTSATGGGGLTCYQNGVQKALFGVSGAALGDTSGDAIIYAETGQGIRFTTNGASERMRIDSSGNVGIGTSSPTAKVGIPVPNYTASSTSGMIRFQNPDVAADSCIQSYYVSSDGSDINIGANSFVDTVGSTDRFSDSYASSAINIRRDGVLTFRTNTSAGDAAERMRIDSSGNVGIGTSSPATNLDVRIDGLFRLGSPNNLIGQMQFFNTTGSTINAQIEAQLESANDGGNLRFYTKATTLSLTERMRIDSSGNLLVGITSARANAGDVQVSKGISFPATQSAQSDANTLDDYEEGTFTPVIVGDTTSGTGTYSVQVGRYTKIGNTVRIYFAISWSAHTGTGGTKITGLPFASNAGNQTPFSVFTFGETFTASNVANGGIMSTGTTDWLHWQVPVGGGNSSAIPIFNGSAEIQVSGVYQAA